MIKIIYIALLLCNCLESNSQHVWDTLEKRVQLADLIFEGQVIKKYSYWNNDKTAVYTTNLVLVSKQFKGTFYSDTVKVLSQGGRVGDIEAEVNDAGLTITLGMEGIFLCTPLDWKSLKLSYDNVYTLYYGDLDLINYSRLYKNPEGGGKIIAPDLEKKNMRQ